MQGWEQAAEGVRLAEAAGPAPDQGPVFVDDRLTVLALQGHVDAISVLAARRLAPLDAIREAQRKTLLMTLHSWLRHWGSRAAVAEELFIHPQTVSYRLTQLRGLFGEDLDDPATRFELLLVLTSLSATDRD